jgi:hypothetical protein
MSAAIAIDKSLLITWIATLPDHDPRLEAVDKIRRGEANRPPEAFLNLKEVAAEVRRDESWLFRLQIQKHCGHRQAGSFRYRVSEVRQFLASAACQTRIAELREQRHSRERKAV